MSYLSSANLAVDEVFRERMTSALTEQAAIYVNDARPEFIALSRGILLNPLGLLSQFTTQASVQPGFNEADSQDDVTDPMLLSVVQALYPSIAEFNYVPDAP